MGLTSKAFSDIITFSRASNATRIGPDGKVAYAPHNLLLRSQEFDNASWGTSFGTCTVTANAAAAPDGTVTADQLAFATAADRYQAATVTSGQTYTFSVWLRVASGTASIRIGVSSPGFSTVTVTTTWQRFTSTFVAGSTTIYPSIDSTSANTVLAWGAQLSAGSIAGDYTPTTSAAVYGPRFDYDPVTLAAKGLLIEEQRTNVATYSESFDNAAWTKGNSSISANAVTAPDGTTTADKLVEDTATTGHVAYQSFVGSAASYTASVFVKSAGRSLIAIRFDDASTLSTSYFDLSTGTVAASGTGATCSITPMGNGWYRCSVTRTLTVATYYFLLSPALTTSSNSYTGDGSSGLYLWGAQIEAGAFATSYIPTVASTVTRSADVASVNTVSPWYNGTEGTIFTAARSIADGAKGSFAAVEISNGSFNKRLLHGVLGSVYRTYYQDPIITLNSSATTTASSDIKMATGFNSSGVALSVNGNSVVSASAWTDSSAVTVLNIANLYGGSYGNCWVKRIAFYPRKLTNAELQALTA